MNISISWHDEEKTIILQEYPDTWTWEDFADAVQRSLNLEKSVSHPVYIICTQSARGQLPKGNIIGHFSNSQQSHPENFRFTVFATKSLVSSVFGNLYKDTTRFPDRIRIADSLGEALELITKDKKALSLE